MGINTYFMGCLGRDAEMKQSEKGVFAVFSVAVSGQRKDETEWLDCCFFGDRARKVAPYLSKGSRVMVSGVLKKELYTDQHGKARCQLKVMVRDLDLCGQMQEQHTQHAQSSHRYPQNTQTQAAPRNAPAQPVDDLPF